MADRKPRMRLNQGAAGRMIAFQLNQNRQSGGAGGGGGPKKGGDEQRTRNRAFPKHWGKAPSSGNSRERRDLVPWPGGYGRGSSMVRDWIAQQMADDAAREAEGGGAPSEATNTTAAAADEGKCLATRTDLLGAELGLLAAEVKAASARLRRIVLRAAALEGTHAPPPPATTKPFPAFPPHWGKPPLRQTRDLVLWPGGYGRGSGTVRGWITKKMKEDKDHLRSPSWGSDDEEGGGDTAAEDTAASVVAAAEPQTSTLTAGTLQKIQVQIEYYVSTSKATLPLPSLPRFRTELWFQQPSPRHPWSIWEAIPELPVRHSSLWHYTVLRRHSTTYHYIILSTTLGTT